MPMSLTTAAVNGYAHTLNLKANGKTFANGNGVAKNGHADQSHHAPGSALLAHFIDSYKQLEAYKYVTLSNNARPCLDIYSYRNGQPVIVDGKTLSIPAVTAAARYGATIALDEKDELKEQVAKSRAVIVSKVNAETSVYGVSTGFGGSGEFDAVLGSIFD